MRPPKQIIAILLLLTCILPSTGTLVGCQSMPALRESRAWHGQTPIYATYRFGLLHAELPPGHSVQTVMAATRSVLYRQGHIIEEASATPQGGKLIALASRELPYDKIKVTTSFEGAGVLITINIDPAEENRSRIVLESILEALAL